MISPFISLFFLSCFSATAVVVGATSPNARITTQTEEEGAISNKKPNVLVILTDEHNLRTIGKYREILKDSSSSSSQSHVWGEGVEVLTENIDSLASDGAIFSNFYSVAPVCTPARGSFMTGSYPWTHGAEQNSVPMKKKALTFAKVLKNNGYSTGYMGKWHLNGDLKDPKEYGAPKGEGRNFGFSDTKYQWNRGHWKFLEEKQGNITGYDYSPGSKKFKNKMSQHYATDFLTTKAQKYIQRKKRNNETFALVLSLPDPHGPNEVRPPYDTMYDHLTFSVPESAKAVLKRKPAKPLWSTFHKKCAITYPMIYGLDQIEEIESSQSYQRQMRNIFGMVKLIDDSVGRILKTLEKTGLENDTIVIFTADHGDMMGEHARKDKGVPYKTSAGVPMIIRWPEKIKAGKVIKSAYSSVDFAPTLLSLVGAVPPKRMNLQGIDASADLLDDHMLISAPSQVRFMALNGWAAAVTENYKLIINVSGEPWLFDLDKDPDELYNVYKKDDEELEMVSTKLMIALNSTMREQRFEITRQSKPVMMDRPTCQESLDVLGEVLPFHTCKEAKKLNYCGRIEVQNLCPVSCKTCSKDSEGQLSYRKRILTCDEDVKVPNLERWCGHKNIKDFCADKCKSF